MLVVFLQRVLTAEYVDGCKINNIAAIHSMGLSLADVSFIPSYFMFGGNVNDCLICKFSGGNAAERILTTDQCLVQL